MREIIETYYTKENYWLQTLRNNLAAGEEIRTLMANFAQGETMESIAEKCNIPLEEVRDILE